MSWAWFWFACFVLTAWALIEAGKWIIAASLWMETIAARDGVGEADEYKVGGTSSDE